MENNIDRQGKTIRNIQFEKKTIVINKQFISFFLEPS